MIEDKKEMHRALFEYLHSRIVLDDELEKFYETFVWNAFIEEVIENFGVKINEFAAGAIRETFDKLNKEKMGLCK